MRYDQPTTPAEMVGSHRVVAHGYYVGARGNQVSPGVTPEQTVGDNVGFFARNGHMLRDMGVGTSRHEDDQLPCCRSRSELDPRTTTARGLLGWETRRAVWENR